MPKIIVQQPFKFAHHGYQVEEFEPSETPRETSAECASLAVAEGWAVDADALQAQREAEQRAAAEQAQREAEQRAAAEQAQREAEQRAAAEQAATDPAATPEVQASAQPAAKRSKKALDGAPETAATE